MTGKRATFYSLFMRFYLWVGLLMLPAGASVLVFAQDTAERATQFTQGGVETNATVVRGWTEFTSSAAREWLEFTYEVEGETYSGSSTTTRNRRVRAEQRGTVPIQYLEQDPYVYELGPGSTGLALWLLRGFGGLIFLVGCYWLWTGFGRIRQLLWLDANGSRETAVVTRIHETGWNTGGKQLKLVWQEPDGSEGRSLMDNEHRFRQYPKDTRIEVLRDPSGKIRSAWAGDLEIWP